MDSKTLAHVHDLFNKASNNTETFVESKDLIFARSFDDATFAVDVPHKIGWIFFHRHDKSVNTLDTQILQKANKLIDEVERYISEDRVDVVVLYSLKKNSFIAGADVNMILGIEDPQQGRKISMDGHKLLFRIEKLRVPTLSAIHGSCLGGGLEVAMSSSHRLASDHKSTQLGLPEVKLGLIPGCGGTVRLPRIIGLSQGLPLILSGASLTAKKAKNLGLVDTVIPYDKGEKVFFENVRNFAKKLPSTKHVSKYSRRSKSFKEMATDSNPFGRSIIEYMAKNNLNKLTRGHYPAPYVALETVMRGYSCNVEEAARMEADNFGKLCCTNEAKNLICLFLMIEETKKIEHFCDPSKVKDIKKIGVLGAGVMGSGICQLAAFKNYNVYMKDVKEEFVQAGMKKVNSLFQTLVDKKKITTSEKEDFMSRVSAGTTYDQLKDADVVIEAAVERLDIKQSVLKEVENVNPNVIFASNTSSIPITDIGEYANDVENILGMHFFHPVHKMPLIEIIKTKNTSESSLGAVYKLSLAMGKIPIVVKDGPGFLTTRLFAVYCLEASKLGLEGHHNIEHIDKLIVDFGMPMGPFRVMDESGLDIGVHVMPVLGKLLGLETDQLGALKELVDTGAMGRKSGKGFYLYDDKGKRAGLNPDTHRIFMGYQMAKKFVVVRSTDQDVVDRCILTLVNEASKCLMEGIAQTPEDVDLGMILGFGFAPFRGGLLKYADDRGLKNVVSRLEQLAKQFGPRFQPTTLLKNMSETDQKFFPHRKKMRPVMILPGNNSKL